MNRPSKHGSAFYSGATRYGGSSAIARREAAKKAFFEVKGIPSIPKTTTTLNGPTVVRSYTINNQDIIRREPTEPQLSSSARRILHWIEETSFSPHQDDIHLSKRRRTKTRFNPMAYIAPVSRPHPPPRLIAPSDTPKLIVNTIPAVEPPVSEKFKSAKYSGPRAEIRPVPCKTKNFASPIDVRPIEKPRPASPSHNPTQTSQPVPTPKVPQRVSPEKVTFSLPTTTLKQKSAPKRPLESPVELPRKFSRPQDSSPSPCKKSSNDNKASTPAPQIAITPKTIAPKAQLRPQPPASIQATTPAPVPNPSATPTRCPVPTLTQAVKPALAPTVTSTLFPTKPIVTSDAPKQTAATTPAVEPPTSDKFKPARYCGPTSEVRPAFCKAKSFQAPIDTKPKQLAHPVVPAQTPTPPRQPVSIMRTPQTVSPKKVTFSSPVGEAKPDSQNFSPKHEQPRAPEQTPEKTLEQATTAATTAAPAPGATPGPKKSEESLIEQSIKSSESRDTALSNNFACDVEMDVETETSSGATPSVTPSSVVPTSITPVAIPPPITTSGSLTTTKPATPISSTITSAPVSNIPTMGLSWNGLGGAGQPPVFMPPPSFPTPTFTAPVPPPVPNLNGSSFIPDGSNPFQPTSSAVRGRKILRPARRLHRN